VHNSSLQSQDLRKMGPSEFAMLGSMLTTEIQQDTHTGPVTSNPRWLRIPSAVKYSGLSRSRLYELLGQRRIKSISLKSRSNALRGVCLVDRESIDLFMESLREIDSSLSSGQL
jgi:predicted DNA-binding transcriptional regulator AlpA